MLQSRSYSHYRIFFLGIAIIWTIFLSILLLQPENHPVIPTGIQPAPPSLKRELLFSSLHLVIFAITAWIWSTALKIERNTKKWLIGLIICLLIYGLSVEYLQSQIPGRSAQWWDMLANAIGIIIGIVGSLACHSQFANSRWREGLG